MVALPDALTRCMRRPHRQGPQCCASYTEVSVSQDYFSQGWIATGERQGRIRGKLNYSLLHLIYRARSRLTFVRVTKHDANFSVSRHQRCGAGVDQCGVSAVRYRGHPGAERCRPESKGAVTDVGGDRFRRFVHLTGDVEVSGKTLHGGAADPRVRGALPVLCRRRSL